MYILGIERSFNQLSMLLVSGTCINKDCKVCSLINSPWLRFCSWLELRGKQRVCYVPQVMEEQIVDLPVCMCGFATDCGCIVGGSGGMAVP